MEKERSIYVSDLIFRILLKWRIILAWMIICAIILNGFAGIKSYRTMVALREAANSSKGDELVSSISLSDEDKEKMEEIYDMYTSYQNTYQSSLDYYNQSVKMNINPNQVPKELIQYRVKTTENATEIVTAFSNAVHNKATCEKIKNVLGEDIEDSYIGELITVEKKENSDTDRQSYANVSVEKGSKIHVMLIRVIASDKKMCKAIADIVEEEIAEESKVFQKTIADFDLTYIDRNYSENSDSDLLYQQQNCLYQLNSVKSSMDNLKSSLTDEQKEYFDELVRQGKGDPEEVSVTSSTEVVEEPFTVDYINIKYILLGLFLGLVLPCCWYFVAYIREQHLLTAQELEEYCGIRILDTFTLDAKPERKKCFIDSLIKKIFHMEPDPNPDVKIKMVCANIQILGQKKNLKRVHITGVASSEEAAKMKQAILSQMDQMDIEVTVGGSVIADQKSLEQMAQSDAVVFVERVRDSVLKEIEKEIEICTEQEVPIIGAVAMN